MKTKNSNEQTEEERLSRETRANGGFRYVFPAPYVTQGLDNAYPYERSEEEGLTKREYFASVALQGMLAYSGEEAAGGPEIFARDAVEYADALIKQLNK